MQFNNKIAYKPTLGQALDEIFGTSTTTVTPPTTTPPTGPRVTGNVNAAVRVAIADASKAYADGQAALKANNFAAYGQAQARLSAALQQLSTLTRTNPTSSPR